MVDVVGAHVVDPVPEAFHLAGDDALDADVSHVVDQNPEDQDRRGERDDGIVIGPSRLDGERRKHEAEEGASRVAEEDRSLSLRSQAEVERQKPQAASQHADGDPAHERLVGLKGHQPHEKRDDRRHPGGQTVHAVDEVHRIGEADDPEDGQHGIEAVAQGGALREEVKDDAVTDQDQDRDHLDEQFVPRRDVPPVVDQADHSHDRAAGDQNDLLRVQDHIDGQGGDEGHGNGDAAQQRRGPGMDLPPAGIVDEAGPVGDPDHQRRQQRGDGEGDQENVKPAAESLKEDPADRGRQQGDEEDQRGSPQDPQERKLFSRFLRKHDVSFSPGPIGGDAGSCSPPSCAATGRSEAKRIPRRPPPSRDSRPGPGNGAAV